MKRLPLFRPLKTGLQLCLILLGLSAPFSAYALDLQTAKLNGWVGEQVDGYLGLVEANPEAKTLTQTVNQKRKQLYLKLAQEHNLTLEQVAARAGQRNIERTSEGLIIQTPSGLWRKK